jgi:conjugal transfer mating pair stabilization protein TraG
VADGLGRAATGSYSAQPAAAVPNVTAQSTAASALSTTRAIPAQDGATRPTVANRVPSSVGSATSATPVSTASMKRSGGVSALGPTTVPGRSGAQIDNSKPTYAGTSASTSARSVASATVGATDSKANVESSPSVAQGGAGAQSNAKFDQGASAELPAAGGAMSSVPSQDVAPPNVGAASANATRDESTVSGPATSPSALASGNRLERGAGEDRRAVKATPKTDAEAGNPTDQ